MADDTLPTIAERLTSAPVGLHELGEPCYHVPPALPPVLAELYRHFDGAELFHGSTVLFAAHNVSEVDGRYHIGRTDEDELYVDRKGRVWRAESDTGELIEEGSRLHRWLFGHIEGEALMYDGDGEFVDDIYGDDGLPTPEFLVRRERRVLKRDREAIGPRWRLARALAAQHELEAARDELEQVVAAREGFAWAWYDLARISESLGELANATEEMEAAATADPLCEYRGFFFAHCARFAVARADEDARRAFAARALELDANLVRGNIDGACERLDADEAAEAKVLIELALALAPLDLAALDLRVQIDEALAAHQPN